MGRHRADASSGRESRAPTGAASWCEQRTILAADSSDNVGSAVDCGDFEWCPLRMAGLA